MGSVLFMLLDRFLINLAFDCSIVLFKVIIETRIDVTIIHNPITLKPSTRWPTHESYKNGVYITSNIPLAQPNAEIRLLNAVSPILTMYFLWASINFIWQKGHLTFVPNRYSSNLTVRKHVFTCWQSFEKWQKTENNDVYIWLAKT